MACETLLSKIFKIPFATWAEKKEWRTLLIVIKGRLIKIHSWMNLASRFFYDALYNFIHNFFFFFRHREWKNFLIIVALLNAHLLPCLMNLWELVEKKNVPVIVGTCFLLVLLFILVLFHRKCFNEAWVIYPSSNAEKYLNLLLIKPWSPHTPNDDSFLLLSFIACLSFLTSSVIEHLHVKPLWWC